MQKNISEFLGILSTLFGGILWGFSGVCGQYLFEQKNISPDWLVPYRLFLAGTVLVIYFMISNPKLAFKPIRDTKLLLELMIYAFFGLLMTQYTYFCAIELSNAAVATVIQYSAPAMILAVVCLMERRFPKQNELIALILAILGVFLLATHGNFNTLAIGGKALVYALISATGIVIYSLVPTRLNKKYPVALNLGWGMVIAGAALALITKPWSLDGVSDTDGFLAFLSVITLGTIFAFSFYMVGVKTIGASKASMIACIEPVSAAIFGYFWLKTEFVLLDFIGFVFIISCILILSKKEKAR